MARVTVEDCLDHVDNRFELVLVASKRARQLGIVDAFFEQGLMQEVATIAIGQTVFENTEIPIKR